MKPMRQKLFTIGVRLFTLFVLKHVCYFAEFTVYDFLGQPSMKGDCFKQLYLPNLYFYSFGYDFLLQLLLYPIRDKPLIGRPRALLNLDGD